jgi:hypothetical protein
MMLWGRGGRDFSLRGYGIGEKCGPAVLVGLT